LPPPTLSSGFSVPVWTPARPDEEDLPSFSVASVLEDFKRCKSTWSVKRFQGFTLKTPKTLKPYNSKSLKPFFERRTFKEVPNKASPNIRFKGRLQKAPFTSHLCSTSKP
jgi:hypothetical protein